MEIKDTAEIKGIHTLTLCKATSEVAQKTQEMIEDVRIRRELLMKIGGNIKEELRTLWEEYRYLVGILHKYFKTQEFVVENITTTVGRSVLAQRLGGDVTYTGTVDYTALGDDNTGEVVGDATLGNEVYRKALSSGTDASNIAYLETFFTAAEDADTYEEYGMYIDGAAGADTGQLFNRFTQTITKSNVETLNVQSVVTFQNS